MAKTQIHISLNLTARNALEAHRARLDLPTLATAARRVLEDWAAGLLVYASASPAASTPAVSAPPAPPPPPAGPVRAAAKPLATPEEKAAASALRVAAQEAARTAAMATRRAQRAKEKEDAAAAKKTATRAAAIAKGFAMRGLRPDGTPLPKIYYPGDPGYAPPPADVQARLMARAREEATRLYGEAPAPQE